MRKGFLVMLSIVFVVMLGLAGCGQKESAEQENDTSAQVEEETEFSPEVEEPKGAEPSVIPEDEADLEETVEGPHAKAFDEGEEIEDGEGVYEEEPVEEEEWEEEPLPEDTEDE